MPTGPRVAQIVPMEVFDANGFASLSKISLVDLLDKRIQPFPSRENQTPRRPHPSRQHLDRILVQRHHTGRLGLGSFVCVTHALNCARSTCDGVNPNNSEWRIPVATATMAASRNLDAGQRINSSALYYHGPSWLNKMPMPHCRKKTLA
jgi:hypothetical protein